MATPETRAEQEPQDDLLRQTRKLATHVGFRGRHLKVLKETLLDDMPIQEEQTAAVLTAMESMLEHMHEADTGHIRILSEIGMHIYPRLKQKSRKDLASIIFSAVREAPEEEKIHAAAIWAGWLTRAEDIDSNGQLEMHEEVDLKELARGSKYLDTFPQLLDREYFDRFGQFLLRATSVENTSQTLEYLMTEHADMMDLILRDMSEDVLYAMLRTFEEGGLLSRTAAEKVRLAPKASEESLTHDYLLQVTRAQRRLDRQREMALEIIDEPIESLEDLAAVYESYNADKPMREIPIEIDGDAQRILFLAGIGLGHQDTAVQFILDTIRQIQSLPGDKKPHVIVINNLLAGAFENRNKGQKAALVPQLQTLEAQFAAGHVLLEELKQALGAPIVLNLGGSDWEIARDIVLRILRYQFQLVGHIPYYEQDQLQRMKEWSVYDRFVVDVALPYCLRKGMVLPAADLLTLFDIAQEMEQARREGREPVISQEDRMVIDVDHIPSVGAIDYANGLYITDNSALTLGNTNVNHRAVIVDDFNFSGSSQPPLYGDPIKSLSSRVIQELAAGRIQPGNSYTLLNQQEMTGVKLGNFTWVDSMPGVRNDDYLTTRGSRKRAMDVSRRLATTRRRMGTEASIMSETMPGRRVYYPFSERLMDLAGSVDRTAIVINGDEQTGSITARPDFMLKAYDIGIRLLEHEKVIWGHFGDEVQGQNYKEKPHQESGVGMQIDVDHQVQLFNLALQLAFSHVSRARMENLVDVKLIPGNHQLNSGFGQYGITHMGSTADTWNRILSDKGSSLRTEVSDNVIPGDGSIFRGFYTMIPIGGYRWQMQHYPLKKNGKGSGSLPIYQSWTVLESLMELDQDTDGHHYQHYHQDSIHMIAGGKLVTIGAAKAGQSEFEHYLGHRAVPGMTMIHLGGGLPPAVEFLSSGALMNHRIDPENFFSDERLKDLGFVTDPGFDPMRDGFIPWVEKFNFETLLSGRMPLSHPRSALQKFIWDVAQKLPLQVNAVAEPALV